MTDAARLAHLVRTVPVFLVDLDRARAAGDVQALLYAHEIEKWLSEALSALQAYPIIEVRDPRVRGVESQTNRGRRPVGDFSSELVSVRDFLASPAKEFSEAGDRFVSDYHGAR